MYAVTTYPPVVPTGANLPFRNVVKPDDPKRVTIGDVARLAQVSKATVSAVLNGTGVVAESTRERVVDAVGVLNYRSGPAMRGHSSPKALKGVGFIIKEIDNPVYAEIILGARSVAQERGYPLVVASSEGDYEAERAAVQLLRASGIDGLIITPVLHDGADLTHLFDLKRRNFPFVLIEQILGVRASLVDVDNTEATSLAATHLIACGHSRLIHLAGPRYSMHTEERINGMRRACSASHIVFTDAQIVYAGAHLEDGYQAGLAYFRDRDPSERATGVTCYNDLVAIGLYRALAELGLRVPDDVSVIGFDDIPLAEYLPVPLSTIRTAKATMGAVAMRMLLDHVESPDVLPPQRATFDVELVVRASVRPPPAVMRAVAANALPTPGWQRPPSTVPS